MHESGSSCASRGRVGVVGALVTLVVTGAGCVSGRKPVDAGPVDGGSPAPVDAGPSDAMTCPDGFFLFVSPGCGDDAPEPLCVESQDACAAPGCSCDGREIIGCDGYDEPYSHRGTCDGSDAGW